MATIYSVEITAKRKVALNGRYQCRNPACQYASPTRVWGEGESKKTYQPKSDWNGSKRITDVPASFKIEATKEAEAHAWACAKQRFGVVRCPRCEGGSAVPWAQFAAR